MVLPCIIHLFLWAAVQRDLIKLFPRVKKQNNSCKTTKIVLSLMFNATHSQITMYNS